MEPGRLSLLVFSRNDIEKALSLVCSLQDIADEIVIVDSSSAKLHARLVSEAEKAWPGKTKVFYTIALGYPDPLRMYALGKCSSEWILLMDTDERLSNAMKGAIPGIISGTQSSAFAIRRYEEAGSEGRGLRFSWQIRLFRRGRTMFRGMLHEEPLIEGDVERIGDDDLFIEHRKELRGKTSGEYSEMEKYSRMSYGSFNRIMLDYLYKFTVPGKRDSGGLLEKVSRGVLEAYEKLGRKKSDAELSYLDYYAFFALRAIVTRMAEHKFVNPFKVNDEAGLIAERMERWKMAKDGKQAFQISKELERDGIIKFLKLDKENTILYLNRKYKNRKQGVRLLMGLIVERYIEAQKRRRRR